MAEIVLGIGASHGPLLSTPPEQWDLRAKADRENKGHWFRGKTYDFESLLKAREPGFANEITVDVRRERFARCRRAHGDARKEVQRHRPRRRRHPWQRPARVLQPGPDARHHGVSRRRDSETSSTCTKISPASISRSRGTRRPRARRTRARRRSPTTSSTRSVTRTSTWRSPTTRRAGRLAAGFRTRTVSCITQFCRTGPRPACPSS